MTLFQNIRTRKVYKIVAAYLALNLFAQLFSPSLALALTNGPSQPEVQSFEPVGTTDMVDLFTGDFNYNLPLFELPGPNGGYPFNLSYHSGISMDQEASWVGLGWNLNPGAIVRGMRGLPDDFNGQTVTRKVDRKNMVTFGAGYGYDYEFAGGDIKKWGNNNIIPSTFTLYYNSYRGIGYALKSGFDWSPVSWPEGNRLGLNLTMDSQEGVGVNPIVSLQSIIKKTQLRYGASGSFSSRQGIGVSMNLGAGKKPDGEKHKSHVGSSCYSFSHIAYTPVSPQGTKSTDLSISFKFGVGAVYQYPNQQASGFYSITRLTKKNTTINAKAYGYNYLDVAENSEPSKTQNSDEIYLNDINREKDGSLSKSSPNLAIPNITYDYFNIQGQGIAASYRPYRSEIGRVFDPPVYSTGAGGSAGFEFGTEHFGQDLELNLSISHTKPWNADNYWSDYYAFKPSASWDDAYADGAVAPEPLYYKSLGELTSFADNEMDYIGGEDAVRAIFLESGAFTAKKYKPMAGSLENSHSVTFGSSLDNSRNNRERIARNTAIYPITNSELCNGSGTPVLPEYNIDYYSGIPAGGMYDATPTTPVNRTSRAGGVDINSHTAGITAFNPDGNRYVYALPVYNLSHHEVAYSVDGASAGTALCQAYTDVSDNTQPDYTSPAGSENYFSETNLGPYTHSFLLTSILGTDYVDVTGDGVTDDDYGYWVKFNYVKTYGGDGTDVNNKSYQWRAPYVDAAYDPGFLSTGKDDKSNFEYGEREMYYLATVETKTHIAVFKISKREDGLSAKAEYAGSKGDDAYYKLDEIQVYSKSDYALLTDGILGNDANAKPLKTIHFKYNYDLCGNVNNNTGNAIDVNGNTVSSGSPDNINSNKGKLTLKEISFDYQNNSRGSLSPYRFDYGERTTLGVIDAANNPDYNAYAYDRWGNFRSDFTACDRLQAPYVRQFDRTVLQDAAHKATFKDTKDAEAAVWCLRTITLPTGGNITVDYESDDYAYVQHKKATQMFRIDHFYDSSNPRALYLKTDWNTTDKWRRRIYFTLETPVPTTVATPSRFFKDYISNLKQEDGTYQMYYKLLMKVRKDSETPEEFISGYCNLLTSSTNAIDYNVSNVVTSDDYGYAKNSTATVDGNSCYTQGFVTVDLTRIRNTNSDDYHPFACASWQFLRTDMPDLLHSMGNITEANSTIDKVTAAHNLLSYLNDFQQMFQGFRKYCFQQDYGRTVADLDYCFIRLTTPDEIKFGGGCRVKQIKINDSWNAQSGEADSEYGQTYTYTTTDSEGHTISSGVASYEPQIGGEETALRHAKHYVDEIPVVTDNDLFFEYPTNESNYPAPVVGYSKVTTSSITTGKILNGTLPDGVRGTGAVVTEFYTAKDFPVITDETMINKKPFDLYIPIPFIGQMVTNDLTASQGYSIVLNDMHGKLKAVTNYGMDNQGNLQYGSPLSSVQYFYKSTDKTMPDGITVSQLDNDVPVIHSDRVNSSGELTPDIDNHALLGEEYEFFTDQRQNNNFSVNAGVDFNVEVPFIATPFPWPSFSTHVNNVKTVATNKIIHKSGILTKVVATDAQSVVTTENKLFDAQTGRPLLVTVTNDFNSPIYRYDVPAYWNFDNMGGAYKNIGFTFTADVATTDATWKQFTVSTSGIKWNGSNVNLTFDELFNILAEGDEYVLQYDDDNDGNFESTETKDRATLIERSTSCNGSSAAVNSLLFHSPASISTGHKVRLTVVRSGRRNLIGVNGGSIVALNDPTSVANRTTAPLSSVSFNNANLATEINAFLNYIIDCNGHIVYKTYMMPGNKYYGADGVALFPSLSSLFSSITVASCEGGFQLIFNLRAPDGSCNQVDCGCITLLPDQTIQNFTYDGGTHTYTIHYEGAVSTFSLSCLELSITPKVTYMTEVLNASAVMFRDYWDYDASTSSCQSTTAPNLYAIGKKGIWRPWMDYYYNDERFRSTSTTTQTNLASDGVFDGNGTNKNFYFFNWQPTVWNPIPSQWVPNNTITRFDRDGNEVENKDILGNYSAARFGYSNTLNTALAANARYDEIYYQSVDDPTDGIALLGFGGTNGADASFAHTGAQSIRIANAQANKTLALNDRYFAENKEYVISMWVGRNQTPEATYSDPTDANSAGVTLTFTDLSGSTISTSSTFKPTGEVIDGWQRLEAHFTTPNNTATNEDKVKVQINFQGGVRGATQLTSYYDDIRIFPANGNMVTYVYDPSTFRLKAKLDDNNYATFYYYDEEGALFLVKQETRTGIATIQEARSHKQHQ